MRLLGSAVLKSRELRELRARSVSVLKSAGAGLLEPVNWRPDPLDRPGVSFRAWMASERDLLGLRLYLTEEDPIAIFHE
jgi:hypothetical protein